MADKNISLPILRVPRRSNNVVELVHVIVVARLVAYFTYMREVSCVIPSEGLRNTTERIHVKGPPVGLLLVACILDTRLLLRNGTSKAASSLVDG